MDSLFLLVPLSLILLSLAVLLLRWAVRTGQYDDLERPGHSILYDDDKHLIPDGSASRTSGDDAADGDRSSTPDSAGKPASASREQR